MSLGSRASSPIPGLIEIGPPDIGGKESEAVLNKQMLAASSAASLLLLGPAYAQTPAGCATDARPCRIPVVASAGIVRRCHRASERRGHRAEARAAGPSSTHPG